MFRRDIFSGAGPVKSGAGYAMRGRPACRRAAWVAIRGRRSSIGRTAS